MLTVFDFVVSNIKCKTSAGWDFELLHINHNDPYPIVGNVIHPNNIKSLHKWDKDGKPYNLPLNHGLHLIPTIPITTYHMVDLNNLTDNDSIESFINKELDRLENI